MAQSENLRNNSFVNPTQYNLLFCVIFRALHLVQPGLMAGWPAGREAGWLAGWPADQMEVVFEIFKIHYRSK